MLKISFELTLALDTPLTRHLGVSCIRGAYCKLGSMSLLHMNGIYGSLSNYVLLCCSPNLS